MPTNIYKQAQAPSQTMGQQLPEEPLGQGGLEETGVVGVKPIGWRPEDVYRPARVEDVGRTDENFMDNIGGIWNGVVEGAAAVAATGAFILDIPQSDWSEHHRSLNPLDSVEAENSFIEAISSSMDSIKESDWHYTPYYQGQESMHSMNPFSEKFSSSYSLGELGHFFGFILPTIPVGAGIAQAAGAAGIGAIGTSALVGGATMLGMGYHSGYEAAKQAGLEGKHRMHFAKAYGAGMAIMGTALPLIAGKAMTGLAPGLIPKSILKRVQKGSVQEAVKAIKQFKGKGSDLELINEMVLAAQKGNAKNIYKHLVKESGTFLKESRNSGAMLSGFTAYDYLTKAVSDVLIDDIEEYKNTNKGKFGIEFNDAEDWKQGIKDTVTSGLFGFVGHGYNSMMKNGAIKAARTATGKEGKTFSEFYQKQTKGAVGNEFDNIKALELRSIMQRSVEVDPKTKETTYNTEKRDKLYSQYEAELDQLVINGNLSQQEAMSVKQNSRQMLQLFETNPNANTNAFMQTWRLDGLRKSLVNIASQNRDILRPLEGKTFNPNKKMSEKMQEVVAEIESLEKLLIDKKGEALKGVEVEKLETLIKSLTEGREEGYGLPKNQSEYLKSYLNDIIIGTNRISVIDGFKDIQNKDYVKRVTGYISNSKVAHMYKDFRNKNVSSRLLRAEKEFEAETAKEIQEKLRSKDFNPADALDYAKTPEQAKEILDVLLEDGRLIDSGFEFKEKLESDLREQFDMESKNLPEAIENVKKKIKEPETLYSDYKQSKLANLESLEDRYQEIFSSGKHAGLSDAQINLAAEKFKELRKDPSYLDEWQTLEEAGHAGAEPIFNALNKAIKSVNPESSLSYRQVRAISDVMVEKGLMSEKAKQEIKDLAKGELLDKTLTPEIIGEFDKVISNDLKESEAIFRTMHNKHVADIEAKKTILKSFNKNKTTWQKIQESKVEDFVKTYEEELSGFGYKTNERFDQIIIGKVLQNAKKNNLSNAEIASQLGLESWLARFTGAELLRESFNQKMSAGEKSEWDVLKALDEQLKEAPAAKEPEPKTPEVRADEIQIPEAITTRVNQLKDYVSKLVKDKSPIIEAEWKKLEDKYGDDVNIKGIKEKISQLKSYVRKLVTEEAPTKELSKEEKTIAEEWKKAFEAGDKKKMKDLEDRSEKEGGKEFFENLKQQTSETKEGESAIDVSIRQAKEDLAKERESEFGSENIIKQLEKQIEELEGQRQGKETKVSSEEVKKAESEIQEIEESINTLTPKGQEAPREELTVDNYNKAAGSGNALNIPLEYKETGTPARYQIKLNENKKFVHTSKSKKDQELNSKELQILNEYVNITNSVVGAWDSRLKNVEGKDVFEKIRNVLNTDFKQGFKDSSPTLEKAGFSKNEITEIINNDYNVISVLQNSAYAKTVTKGNFSLEANKKGEWKGVEKETEDYLNNPKYNWIEKYSKETKPTAEAPVKEKPTEDVPTPPEELSEWGNNYAESSNKFVYEEFRGGTVTDIPYYEKGGEYYKMEPANRYENRSGEIRVTEKVTKEEFLKRQPTAEAPVKEKPYKGSLLSSEYYKEFETEVNEALDIKRNPNAFATIAALPYLQKIKNLTANRKLEKYASTVISRIGDYTWLNKTTREWNEQNPNQAKKYKRLDDKQTEEMRENWESLVEMIKNEPELLNDIARTSKTIHNKIIKELPKEIRESEKGLGSQSFNEFKNKYGIQEESFLEAYRNMYKAGYHLFDPKSGERAYVSGFTIDSLPTGKFLIKYRNFQTMRKVALDKGFLNAEEMLKYDGLYPEYAPGKLKLESLGFGDKNTLGFMEPYTHLKRAVSLRKKDLIEEGLLRKDIGTINLKDITPEIIERVRFSVAESSLLRGSTDLDPFLTGDKFKMFYRFEPNVSAYKGFTDMYKTHFKLADTTEILNLKAEIEEINARPMPTRKSEIGAREDVINKLNESLNTAEKKNIHVLSEKDLLEVVNDMRDRTLDTEYADMYNPEYVDLIGGFNEVGRARSLTKNDLEKLSPSVGNEIAARLKLYTDHYDIKSTKDGLRFFLKKDSGFIPPSRLIRSFHTEKGKYKAPLPKYRHVPTKHLKNVEAFERWIKQANPNRHAISELGLLTSRNFDRNVTRQDLIDIIESTKIKTGSARSSISRIVEYLKDSEKITQEEVKKYKSEPKELEGLLQELGLLENFAGEKLSVLEFRKQIHEADYSKQLSSLGLKTLEEIANSIKDVEYSTDIDGNIVGKPMTKKGRLVRKQKLIEKDIIDEIKNFIETKNADVRTIELLESENPFFQADVRTIGKAEGVETHLSMEWLKHQKKALQEQYRLENITSEAQIKKISDHNEYREVELKSGLTSLNNETLEYFGYGKEKWDRLGSPGDFETPYGIKDKAPDLYKDVFLDMVKDPNEIASTLGKYPKERFAAFKEKFNLNENDSSRKLLDSLKNNEVAIDKWLSKEGKGLVQDWLQKKKNYEWDENNPLIIEGKSNTKRNADVSRLIDHMILGIKDSPSNFGRIILKKTNLSSKQLRYLKKGKAVKFINDQGSFVEIRVADALKPSQFEKGWAELNERYGEVVDPRTNEKLNIVERVKKNNEDYIILSYAAKDINTGGYKLGKSRADQQMKLARTNEKLMGKYELLKEDGSPLFKEEFKKNFGLEEGMTIPERIEELMPFVIRRKTKGLEKKIQDAEDIVKTLEDNMFKLLTSDKTTIDEMKEIEGRIKIFNEYNTEIAKSKYRKRPEIKDSELDRKQLEVQGRKMVNNEIVHVEGQTKRVKEYVDAMRQVDKLNNFIDRLYISKATIETIHQSKLNAKKVFIDDFKKAFKDWKSETWLDLSVGEKEVTTLPEWGFSNIKNLLKRDYKYYNEEFTKPSGKKRIELQDNEFARQLETLYEQTFHNHDAHLPYERITVAELEHAINTRNAQKTLTREKGESIEEFQQRQTDRQVRIEQQRELWKATESELKESENKRNDPEFDELNTNSAVKYIDGSPTNILSIREPQVTRNQVKTDSNYNNNKKMIIESEPWKERSVEVKRELGAILDSVMKFDKYSEKGKLNGLTKEQYIDRLINKTADFKSKREAIPVIKNHTINATARSKEGKPVFSSRRLELYLETLKNNNERYDIDFQLVNGVPFRQFLSDNKLKFQGEQDAKIIGRTGSKAPITAKEINIVYDNLKRSQVEQEKARIELENEGNITTPREQTYERSFYDSLIKDPLKTATMMKILQDKFPDIKVEWSPRVTRPGGDVELKGLAKTYADKQVVMEELKGNRLVLEDGTVVNRSEVKALVRAVEFSESLATLDTIPHEYGHHYIDMFAKHDLVANAVREVGKETGKTGDAAREMLVQKLGEDFAAEVFKIKNKETTLDKSLGKKWFKWAYDFYDLVKSVFSSNPMKTEYQKLYDAFKQGYSPKERAEMHQREREKRGIGYERDQFKIKGFGYKNNLEEVDPLSKEEIVVSKPQEFKSPQDIPLDIEFAKKQLGYTDTQIDRLKAIKSGQKGADADIKKLQDQYVSKLYQENLSDKFIYSELEGGIKLDSKIKQELDYVLSKLDELDPAMQKVFMNTHFSKFTGATNHLSNILKFIGGHENSHLYNSTFGELYEGKRSAHKINRISKFNFGESLKESYGGSTERAGIEYGGNAMKIVDGKSTKEGEVSGRKIAVDNGSRKILLTDSEIAQVYRTINSLENNGSAVASAPDLHSTTGQVFSIYGKENVLNRKENNAFKLTEKEVNNIKSVVEGSPEMMKLVESSKKTAQEIASIITPIYKNLKGVELDQLSEYITVIREVENRPLENFDEIILESFFKQRDVEASAPIAIRGIMKNAVDYSASAMRFAETKVGNHNLKQLVRVLDNHSATSPFLEKIQNNLVPQLEKSIEYYNGNSIQHEIKNPLAKKASNLATKFMDNFPVFALGYNPFVSLKQSVSYLMASPEINKKYFSVKDFTNIADVSRKGFASWLKTGGNKELAHLDPYLSELYQNSPMFQERLQGRLFKEISETIDTSLNPITGQDIYSGVHFAGKKMKTNKFLRKTRAMEWIPIVDAATIAQIYKSCKLELENEGYNGKPLQGQELIDAAIRKTEFITNKTQPTFDKLWSSEFRDSKNVLMRGLSMFGAQPHKNYNYALESLFDYYVNDRAVFKNKMMGAMSGAFILQPLALAMLGIPSLLATQAFSYDDEKTYTTALQSSIKRSLSTIPGGKVLAGLSATAYSKSWRGATGIHPISSIGRDITNVFDDGYYTQKGNAERTAKVVAALSGMPGFPIKHAGSIMD